MISIAPIVLNALSAVLILALVAIGLVVVFGMMGVINMAHGELFMLGAYAVVAATRAGIPFWPAVVLAPIAVGLLGAVIEELLIRPIYHRTLDTILATWGLSIALRQGVVLAFGPASYNVEAPISTLISLGGGATYPVYRLVVMALAVLVIGLFLYLFQRTDFGLMARAVIARPAMAASLGINPRRMNRIAFVAGAAVAGLAGALVAPLISVDPQMGLGYLIPAFLSILVGGMGAVQGMLAGSTIVGGTDNLLTIWISPVAAQIIVFALAILVIRLKPQGLLGARDGA
jgi:urea transport system permease protein